MTDRRDEPVVVQQSSDGGGSGTGIGILVGLAIVALVVAVVWWSGMLNTGGNGGDGVNPLQSVIESVVDVLPSASP